MRIAVVSNTSWSIYNFRRNLIRALRNEGHEVAAVGSQDGYLQRLQSEGFEAVGVRFTRAGVGPLQELRTIWAIRRALVQQRSELVLSFTPKGNIYTALAIRGLKCRQIANVSGLGAAFVQKGVLMYLVLILYRATFRRMFHVFFQNDQDQALFLVRGVVDPARASRVPGSGVDLGFFLPAPFRGSSGVGPVFLLLGRLLWDKGAGEFAEAARKLKRDYPSARFLILGAAESEDRYGPSKRQLESWMREGLVEYLGWVDDVRPYIETADCVVLPTTYREGVPRSLLEAAAMGRPVIASDSVGSRDAVDHEQTGFLCKPRDVQDLLAAMRRVIAMGPEGWAEMGRKARRKMEREFDEVFVIRRYSKVLQDIAVAGPR